MRGRECQHWTERAVGSIDWGRKRNSISFTAQLLSASKKWNWMRGKLHLGSSPRRSVIRRTSSIHIYTRSNRNEGRRLGWPVSAETRRKGLNERESLSCVCKWSRWHRKFLFANIFCILFFLVICNYLNNYIVAGFPKFLWFPKKYKKSRQTMNWLTIIYYLVFIWLCHGVEWAE